jgi:DNA-binding CsgD family transcriptional regulator
MAVAPLLLVEGPPREAGARLALAIEAARAEGWTIVKGWAAPLARDRVICTGRIRNADDARRALLAAVAGAGLLVTSSAGPDTLDRFVDDLRRLGPVERVAAGASEHELTAGQRTLLGLLTEGLSMDQAAVELGVTRRTAERRLAAARRVLGADSTGAAIAAALARRDHPAGR